MTEQRDPTLDVLLDLDGQVLVVDPEGCHWVRFVITRVPVSPEKPHGINYSLSSVRPEQLIEEIAKPCLEYVELGVGNRHTLRPIIGDGPGRKIVLRRPTEARPRLVLDVKIVGQDAQAGAGSGHSGSIAPACRRPGRWPASDQGCSKRSPRSRRAG